MRVGTLCYATDSGLGVLAKAFYDHGIVTHPLVVRHAHHPTHDDWYPGAPQTPVRPIDVLTARDLCRSVDVMLFFETPFDWSLIPYCREHGIKTVLMPMYECTPRILPAMPDLFVCPSLLDLRYFPNGGRLAAGDSVDEVVSVHIPVPVDVPWRKRERARVFVHNAGHGGLKGRNGTRELLEALWLCNCLKGTGDARFIIRSQKPLPEDVGPRGDLCGRLTWQTGTVPAADLYAEGDVFVFPEKFNGLSLPLQEARAAGMLVMATERFPNNTYLPKGPLIPVAGYRPNRIGAAYTEFKEAVVDPKEIAAKIDDWYDRDISDYSEGGKQWAETMSWGALGPKYRTVLGDLVAGK